MRIWKHARWTLATVAAMSCEGARSPLASIGPVSHLIIREGGPNPRTVVDRASIDSLLQFLSSTRGWNEPWDTPPAGRFSIALMRDTAIVGVFWLGPTYVMSRRLESGDQRIRLRNASIDEVSRVTKWFNLPAMEKPQ